MMKTADLIIIVMVYLPPLSVILNCTPLLQLTHVIQTPISLKIFIYSKIIINIEILLI